MSIDGSANSAKASRASPMTVLATETAVEADCGLMDLRPSVTSSPDMDRAVPGQCCRPCCNLGRRRRNCSQPGWENTGVATASDTSTSLYGHRGCLESLGHRRFQRVGHPSGRWTCHGVPGAYRLATRHGHLRSSGCSNTELIGITGPYDGLDRIGFAAHRFARTDRFGEVGINAAVLGSPAPPVSASRSGHKSYRRSPFG